MERLVLGIDLESQAHDNKQSVTAKEQRRQSIQRCIQSLEHATYCDDHSCQLHICLKIKKVSAHAKQCKGKTNGGCTVCKQFIALCCYHAKHCNKTNCMVPYCSHIKQKLRKQQLQQRLQETKLMRRRIQAMQAGAQRPPPLPVSAVPPSIQNPVQPVPPQAPVQTIPQKPVSVHPVQLVQNLPGADPPPCAVNAAAQVAQQINRQIAVRQAQPSAQTTPPKSVSVHQNEIPRQQEPIAEISVDQERQNMRAIIRLIGTLKRYPEQATSLIKSDPQLSAMFQLLKQKK